MVTKYDSFLLPWFVLTFSSIHQNRFHILAHFPSLVGILHSIERPALDGDHCSKVESFRKTVEGPKKFKVYQYLGSLNMNG